MPATRVRNVVFTWNNPPEDHEKQLKDCDDISYCIYQIEEVSTRHLQGYLELKKQMSFNKLAKKFPWHIEARKGSQAQAIEYCSKEESRVQGPWEWGEKKVQGTRTDIDGMYAAIRAGKRERDIAEDMPTTHAKYFKAHDRYRSLIDYDSTKDFRTVSVTILWGEAGTGKTRMAVEDSDDYYILNAPTNGTLWFDGYQGEKTLIIDDFYGWIKFNEMLRIMDGYQLRLPVKGSFVYAKWTKVFITSNKKWSEWYPNVTNVNLLAAFERRISEIKKI